MEKLLIPGSVSTMQKAGIGFKQSTSVSQSLTALKNAVPANVTVSVLFTGKVTSVTNASSGDFAFGEGEAILCARGSVF